MHLRHQIEAEEALRLQQAQDVAAGKLRKKRKDGADLGDESDDEEKFGTSAMRKEWRRKRKLDKLDPLDALGAPLSLFFLLLFFSPRRLTFDDCVVFVSC